MTRLPQLSLPSAASFLLTSLACTQNFTWTPLVTSPNPGIKAGASAVWDAARQRAVLFGGYGNSNSNATWEWDGTAWQQMQPSTLPPARHHHAMAYDANRQRVVLFGGSNNAGDTWEWDGSNWTQKYPSTSPPTREGHKMAYFPPSQTVVLFGGSGSPMLSDTWEWDGINWTQASPQFSPPGRTTHAMAYDEAGQRIVVVGGYDGLGGGFLADTWQWDGTTWAPVFGSPFPPPVSFSSLTYDSGRHSLVLFGGQGNSTFSNATWELSGSTWTPIQASTSPSPRYQHCSFYDPTQGRTVVYGGSSGGPPLGDMWINGIPPVNATATAFGAGCGSPPLAMTPDPTGRPVLGTTGSTTVANAPTAFGGMAMGWSNTQYGPFPLPVPLNSIGMPGCILWQSTEILGLPVSPTGTPGVLSFSQSLPNNITLLGTRVYLQAYCLAPGANPLDLVTSNAVEWTLGDI